MIVKFWRRLVQAMAGRGNCQVGKVIKKRTIIKKNPDKKLGRKGR